MQLVVKRIEQAENFCLFLSFFAIYMLFSVPLTKTFYEGMSSID